MQILGDSISELTDGAVIRLKSTELLPESIMFWVLGQIAMIVTIGAIISTPKSKFGKLTNAIIVAFRVTENLTDWLVPCKHFSE